MPKKSELEFFTRAVMVGLMAAAQAACSESSNSSGENSDVDESTDSGTPGEQNSDEEGSIVTDGSGSAGTEPNAGSKGGSSATGGSSGDVMGGQGGEGGAQTEVVGVLSSKVVPDLSLQEFAAMCDTVDGVVETHAVCHGRVTGPGFSYDSDSDVFTEHTCAGYNTCAGFSCVVPE